MPGESSEIQEIITLFNSFSLSSLIFFSVVCVVLGGFLAGCAIKHKQPARPYIQAIPTEDGGVRFSKEDAARLLIYIRELEQWECKTEGCKENEVFH